MRGTILGHDIEGLTADTNNLSLKITVRTSKTYREQAKNRRYNSKLVKIAQEAQHK